MTRLIGSAAYRIALATSAAFTLATTALGIAVFFSAHDRFVAQLEGEVANDSKALVGEFNEGGIDDLAEGIAEREQGNSANELVYAIFAADGRRIAGSMDATMPALGWSDITFRDPREGPDPARALTVGLADGSRLVVAADWSSVDRGDRVIISLFGFAFAVQALFGVAGALLLGGYLKHRLSTISVAAGAIMAGDITQRIAIGPQNDEFDRLSATLNAMLDRIQGLLGNLRQVSADIAHDLRTPLAAIRNQLEDSLHANAGVDSQRAAMEEAMRRIDEVLTLFAAILRIAEVEGGSVKRGFASVDMGALVTELCESYAPAIEDGGRMLNCAIEQDIALLGDRELLAQALINLLDNAVNHTPPGSEVTVELRREQGTILLTVADNGPGVAEADRERIVQRFVRLESSRSTPGHGLGLNLVNAIARAHGATLEIGGNAPGLRASLRFANA